MFAMAFAPCGDASEVDTSQQIEQITKPSITGAVDIEYGMEKQQEECSPICPCQCCPSIDSDTTNLSEIASITPVALTAKEKHLVSSVASFLIWSPPQRLS